MDFVRALQKAGYKCTKPRLALLSHFKNSASPQTPQQIHRSVKRQGIDLTTVYRTLEVFRKVGIVFREEMMSESRFFLAEKEHHHIICRTCGTIRCLPCNVKLPKPKGFSKIKHAFTLTGICSDCT
ncbi:MAG: Fur family transcriptional regulator [Patescibacteria group bacterium]